MAKKTFAVLIGRGSRLAAIVSCAQKLSSFLEIALVVSHKTESPGVDWAKEHNISALYHRWTSYKEQERSREEFNEDLAKLLKEKDVEYVLGVGWDIIWTPNFLDAFPDRVFNTHPFPLPDTATETIIYENQVVPVLRGMDALKRAWEMGLPITGTSIHIARATVDVGPMIVRDILPIQPNESLESLEVRHKEFEEDALCRALTILAYNDFSVFNERIMLTPKANSMHRDKKTILVIGAGGREHAIVWKLSQSPLVEKIYAAPGNAGMQSIAEIVNIAIDDFEGLVLFAKEKKIDLTIVGPELPLSKGIVDRFTKESLKIFGPTKDAARLETSKAWAIEFLKRHAISYPQSETFSSYGNALEYTEKIGGICVVKADGLTGGKGVFMCENLRETGEALTILMKEKKYGEAGNTVVIQERLIGQEVSVMAFCDGNSAVPLVPARDYKKIYENDLGGNTGGVGAYAPVPFVTSTLMKKMHKILTLVVSGMKEEGYKYKGILYGGFMIVGDQPYILEFNVRFGDPETQVQLPLLESDLVPIIEACIEGSLDASMVKIEDASCACVILTSGGYPGTFEKGKVIQGLEKIPTNDGIYLFHAGTTMQNNQIVSSGGRVLAVTGKAPTIEDAVKKSYTVIGKPLSFENMYFRTDIAKHIPKKT